MKASRFLNRDKPPGLMLTSLLDMFTIILIFLIVSFEAEDYDFKLDPTLTLPESTARSVFKPAVNIAITPQSVLVDRVEVVKLVDGKATPEQYAAGEIPELVDALQKHYERIQAEAAPPDEAAEAPEQADPPPTEGDDAAAEDEDDGSIILVQADRNHDYKTVYLVLRSASIAGFVRYRLAILKK